MKIKNIGIWLVLTTGAIGLSLPVGAAEEMQEDPCEGSGSRQVGLCAAMKLEEEKKGLEAALQEVVFRVSSIKEDPEISLKRLEDSQQAWQLYVEKNCDLLGISFTSTSWGAVHSTQCESNEIRERIKFLNTLWAG